MNVELSPKEVYALKCLLAHLPIQPTMFENIYKKLDELDCREEVYREPQYNLDNYRDLLEMQEAINKLTGN